MLRIEKREVAYGFLSGWNFLLRFLYAFLISRSVALFFRPSSCRVTCQWSLQLEVTEQIARRHLVQYFTYLIVVLRSKNQKRQTGEE